jgi:hypothetical protein
MTGCLSRIVLLASALIICCALILVWLHHMALREPQFKPHEIKLMAVQGSVLQFYRHLHFLPRTLSDLIAPNGIENWGGPYARRELITDGWGNPVSYEMLDSTKPIFRLSIAPPNGGERILRTYEP